jgi:hypothetical protein
VALDLREPLVELAPDLRRVEVGSLFPEHDGGRFDAAERVFHRVAAGMEAEDLGIAVERDGNGDLGCLDDAAAARVKREARRVVRDVDVDLSACGPDVRLVEDRDVDGEFLGRRVGDRLKRPRLQLRFGQLIDRIAHGAALAVHRLRDVALVMEWLFVPVSLKHAPPLALWRTFHEHGRSQVGNGPRKYKGHNSTSWSNPSRDRYMLRGDRGRLVVKGIGRQSAPRPARGRARLVPRPPPSPDPKAEGSMTNDLPAGCWSGGR